MFFCREWGLSASGGLPKGYPTGRPGEGLAALQSVHSCPHALRSLHLRKQGEHPGPSHLPAGQTTN